MALLKNDAHYQWYASGKSSVAGSAIRHDDLPPFEYIQDDTIRIVSGEIFCRFAERGSQNISCPYTKKFGNTHSLRNHVSKQHPVKVEGKKAGKISLSDIMEAIKYYEGMQSYMQMDNMPVPNAPRKGIRSVASPQQSPKVSHEALPKASAESGDRVCKRET